MAPEEEIKRKKEKSITTSRSNPKRVQNMLVDPSMANLAGCGIYAV